MGERERLIHVVSFAHSLRFASLPSLIKVDEKKKRERELGKKRNETKKQN